MAARGLNTLRAVVVACLSALVWISPAGADTYTVEWDGSGDHATIQDAIDDASDTDVIELGDGTFTGEGNRDISFPGKSITVRSQSGAPWACVIDADGSASGPLSGVVEEPLLRDRFQNLLGDRCVSGGSPVGIVWEVGAFPCVGGSERFGHVDPGDPVLGSDSGNQPAGGGAPGAHDPRLEARGRDLSPLRHHHHQNRQPVLLARREQIVHAPGHRLQGAAAGVRDLVPDRARPEVDEREKAALSDHAGRQRVLLS